MEPNITVLEEPPYGDSFEWADQMLKEWMDTFAPNVTFTLVFPPLSFVLKREITRFCGRLRIPYNDDGESLKVTKFPQTKIKMSRYISIVDSVNKRLRKIPQGISKITENLYLGSVKDAQDKEMLLNLGITHIINVTNETLCHHAKDFEYLRIPVYDREEENIAEHFESSSLYISSLNNGEKVFVHCMFGYSRSPSIVLAYLLKFHNKTLKESLNHVLQVRPIKLNSGFVLQLKEYEKSLYGNCSVIEVNWNEIILEVTSDSVVDKNVLAP